MNQLYRSLLFGIFSLCVQPSAMSFQEKIVKDNLSVNAFVAEDGLTRIAIANDRIRTVRGIPNTYQIEADLNQGVIFIKPIHIKKTFTLFIATENNHNYLLHLIPRIQNSDTILLKPHIDLPLNKNFSYSHRLEIIKLMASMMHYTESLRHPNKFHSSTFLKPIHFEIEKTYYIHPLKGSLYKITNTTGHILSLQESAFYKTGDLAIKLSHFKIHPNQSIWLYKVSFDD